jgi:hypothetical protein
MHDLCITIGMVSQGASAMATKKTAKKAKQAQGPCWPGYHRVPGTKPFTKGSCAKDSAKTSKKADK